MLLPQGSVIESESNTTNRMGSVDSVRSRDARSARRGHELDQDQTRDKAADMGPHGDAARLLAGGAQ
jgi:hypothetical protein